MGLIRCCLMSITDSEPEQEAGGHWRKHGQGRREAGTSERQTEEVLVVMDY